MPSPIPASSAMTSFGWGGTRVMDPSGDEWVVRRKWVHRKLRWRGSRRSFDFMDGADLAGVGGDLPVIGVALFGIAVLLFAIGLVMLVVPVLIFVVELALVVLILGIGLAGRVLFGRPWTVEAQRLDDGVVHE